MQAIEHEILVTKNFHALEYAFNNGYRGVCLEGSSRSSKSWGISQFLATKAIELQGLTYTIARDVLNILKYTTYKTFKDAWISCGLSAEHFNKNATRIDYNMNEIRFTGINDNLARAHGMEQDILWINEAIFVSKDSFDQMLQRTNRFCILDFNPSEEMSWVYDVADKREDFYHVKSTYKDNPFVSEISKAQIESYNPDVPKNIEQNTADNYKWKVYGLGERSASEARIYKHFDLFTEWPKNENGAEYWDYRIYWLDFGFTTDPSTFGETRILLGEKAIYSKEYFYKTGLTNQAIAEKIKSIPEVDTDEIIVADSAEKKSIKELRLLDLHVVGALKGPDSVRHGINIMKRFRHFIHAQSDNMQREKRGYKWKKDKGTNKLLAIPDKSNDHTLDGERYAVTFVIK